MPALGRDGPSIFLGSNFDITPETFHKSRRIYSFGPIFCVGRLLLRYFVLYVVPKVLNIVIIVSISQPVHCFSSDGV